MTETSQRGLLDFSPVKKDHSNKENEVPVLSLIQFSRAPFVIFGTVKLGTSRSSLLRIENPTDDAVAEVTIEKISSTKGFSANHNRFIIQPDSSFTLTITWTPAEEGGIRELIVFSANGVLKHQAVLLGRAEATKKKKKSLWDSIKNKRAANPTATPRCKNNESTLKITANKTFQVPRKPQYKREKPRSPLTLFNEGVALRERSLSKPRSVEDGQEHQRPPKAAQRPKGLAGSGQAQVRHAQENTAVLLLAQADELADLSHGSAVLLDLLGTPDHPGSSRVLNRTLSPVGTPDVFRRLMPHIQSLDSPVIDAFPASENVREPTVDPEAQRLAPALTLSDALALIDSDLHTGSSHSSSDILSDSLESASGSPCPGPVKPSLDVIPDSPDPSERNGQRCTFFVSKNATASGGVAGPMTVSVHTYQEVKKTSFTSATVTKSKAAAAVASPNVCSPGGRQIRKSRRRLLEKTLELSQGSSQCESSPGTPGLPIIDLDSGAESWPRNSEATSSPHGPPTPVIFPFTSLPELSPAPTSPRVSFTATSPSSLPPSPRTLPTFSPHLSSPVSVPLMFKESSSPAGFPLSPVCPKTSEALPPYVSTPDGSPPSPSPPPPAAAAAASSSPPPAPLSQEVLMFPVHTKAQLDLAKSKKRKSDEHLRVEDVARPDRVKRSRVVAATTRESMRSVREKKRAVEKPQRQHSSAVRSTTASSMKSARAVAPATSKSALRGALSLKAFRAGPTRTAKVVAVAQAKLTFIKPPQTAIPRHPMPFAAKNMFYDERWIEKQESGFTCWINYILTPDDFKVNLEVTKVNALSIAMGSDDKYSVPEAPTKEELSFSTYTARRRLNRLRRSACQLFTSEVMVKAIQRLELEVEAKRLLVRKDRHLWKDIGERQKVLNWLLSYNPLWLRIGLETIYGELIPLESNSDVLGLAMFILTRLLWNPDIATEFRHAKVPHLYKDGHEEVLSRFTLKKLLLLVCFLDKAKESRLIEHDPCLFCMDAEFKTSKDLLLGFSRDFLSGEGILPRHMGYLGLPVSHVQTPLDEFNFAVKNLAVDLKCGIRLVRVMELFLQDWSLSRRLRLPAISRLQKVHNVDIAFQVLKAKGIDLRDEQGSNIDSRDIVDGHREKTLSLLWKIIFAFQVEVILEETQLREEIGFLKRTLRTKRRLASLRADRGLQQSSAGRGPAPVPFETSSTKIGLLMEWVNAVCDYYNLRVENFTVSFSDGRVLCYLIHHYHPGSLPEQAISHSTTQTVDCSPLGSVELDCSNSDLDGSFNFQPSVHKGLESPSFEFKDLLEKEKNNFRLVNSAVAFLGGVPAMINPTDMSNTIPNEKVVTSYLSFLCSRLLDLRNETRAARVIQGAWRKYRLMKDLVLYQQRNVSAAKIQVLVKSFLQRRRAERKRAAAILIQARWRGYAARNALRLKREAQLWALRHNAAMVIQARWKMYSAKRSYQCLRYHIVIVQAQWRMRRAAITYSKIHSATTVIQTYTRAWAMARRERGRYMSLRTAAVEIQRGFRRWRALRLARESRAAIVIQAAFRKWHMKNLTQRSAAALKIQSWYRMRRCVRQYLTLRRSAVVIQALFRGRSQRSHLQTLMLQQRSTLVIQSAFRGHAVRKHLAKKRLAAIIVQRWFRACVKRNLERQSFLTLRHAAIIIQAVHRGNTARAFLREQCCAATVIQAAFRRFAAERHYLALKTATTVIQQWYRAMILAHKTREEYGALKCSAVVIQRVWRGRADRKRLERLHEYATLIQASYRRHRAQALYRSTKLAAVFLQCHFRAYMAKKIQRAEYLQLKAAAITLQANFRGMKVRMQLDRKHRAATLMQSVGRMLICRKRYLLLQSATVIVQSRYRALIEGRVQQLEYRQQRQAAINIQAAFRGLRVRRELRKQHTAATAIQAHFRMYRVRMAYLATRCAAIILQERYRAQRLGIQQARRYMAMRSAAVIIQAGYRGHMVRQKLSKMHCATTVIQRWFQAYRDRRHFLTIKATALLFQRTYRAVVQTREIRSDYLLRRRAAISLQAAYRGMKARQHLQALHKSAVKIQSFIRMFLQRTYYKNLHWAITTVQCRYKHNKKMREKILTINAQKNAAVVLQAAFRGMKTRQGVRRMHQAASTIQRGYRALRERKQYIALKSSALKLQQQFRAKLAARRQLQQYQQIRRAVILLQAAYRGQQVRNEISRQHQAATMIQASFRKYSEQVKFQAMRLSTIIIQRYYRALILQRADRGHFLKVKQSAIVLQAAFRGMVSRRKTNKMHQAANTIQRAYRAHCERRVYFALKSTALKLQQRFRANLVAKHQLQNYQQIRRAVFLIQAAYRGQQVRKEIFRQHRAATVIQASFRKHREQVKFQAMRLSTIIIQRYYRSCVLQRADRGHFLKVKQAAIVLQAAFRGHCVRMNISKMQRAATVIQANYRRYKQQSCFRRRRWAALVLQQRFRAQRLQSFEVKNYQQLRNATITLQAAFRGLITRQAVRRMHQAASAIQQAYRAHCERKSYLTLKSSALTLQRWFRANLAAKHHLQQYQQIRRAVILLQAAYRGQHVRKEISHQHQAATMIQASFRKYSEQVKFKAMRLSTIIIQRYYRSLILQRADRGHFLKVKQSAIVLQAAFRGMVSRRKTNKMHQAANTIQRAYRAHCERRVYLALKSSALKLQQRFRANLVAKHQLQKYQQIRRAVFLIQAAYRGQQVRKEISRQHQAATAIQASFRKHREQVKFQAMRLSTIIIQRYYRSCVLQRADRGHFLKVKQSAIVLQAAFRGHCVRMNISKMQRAAIVIQANYRRYKQQSCFRRWRWAALVLQQRFRAQRLQSLEVKHYQRIRNATITLQAALRGLITRQSVRRMHQAASAIQQAYRAQCERKSYLTLKSSALTLQRRFRANLAAKHQLQQYQQIRRAVIFIQAAYRGQHVRKELSRQHQAATAIQASFRKYSEQVKFQAMRLSTIIIQRYYRSCVLQRADRGHFLKVKQSAIVLQAAFRGHCVRMNICKMQRAATVIQANYRRFKHQSCFRRQHWAALVVQQRFRAQRLQSFEVKNYQQLRRATITLQAAFRGMATRRKTNQIHQAASAIQRGYRAHCARKQYVALKSSALTLQRRFRANLAAQHQLQQYWQIRRAVILFQAAYRGQRVRKAISRQHRAATVIQASFRKHREQVKFKVMRRSTIIIQRYYRSCVLQKADRGHFLKVKQSAIVLQAAFRGHFIRRAINEQNHAATLIQSRWRSCVQRRAFQRLTEAAITLQRILRALWLARATKQHYMRKRRAATILQAHFRGWIARRQLLEAAKAEKRRRFIAAAFQHISAMKIQRALRAHWALQSAKKEIHSVIAIQRWVRAWQQRRQYLEERRNVVRVQRTARRWLARRHQAASVIQHAARRFLLLRRQQRVLQGVIKAQALWRGHRDRKLTDDPMVVSARQRLRKVSDSVREEDKLGNKTASALDYLLRYRHFSYILEALKNLETATRLSPECCERLVESGATLVIFTLIRSCNRSVPCMDVITFSIQILLNLSKYHKTVAAVYVVENSVETLLDLLQRYRDKAGDKVADKGGSIFTKACFLLALLLQDRHRALEVSKLPKALDRIRSVYRLTARKYQMDMERTIVKHKMNASSSSSSSFLVQATPRKSRPVRRYDLESGKCSTCGLFRDTS